MNSDNLIRLGAFAQRALNMLADFKIMRVPADADPCIRVAVIEPFTAKMLDVDTKPVPELAYEHNIILSEVGFRDNMESIRIGYSSEANVLIIQD